MLLNILQGLALTTLATATPIFKRDFPDPEPITGDVQGFVHDPTGEYYLLIPYYQKYKANSYALVIRRGENSYYLFTTNNKTNIRSAPSMNGPWTHLGSALPAGSVIDLPGRDDTWAPDVAKMGDTYYLYYSVSDWGAQNKSDIGVATSKTLEPGSWVDHGSIGIPLDQRYNRIDPNLLYGAPGSPPLLAFGSFHDNVFQVSHITSPCQPPNTSVLTSFSTQWKTHPFASSPAHPTRTSSRTPPAKTAKAPISSAGWWEVSTTTTCSVSWSASHHKEKREYL
jgi:arabinan endo-1,5-alpha-L-arabinosidase